MNIVNKLTVKHMRMNRKRTLVTIVGVIISVAMITAVATLSVSFLNMMARDTIARGGLWHVEYNNLSEEQLATVENDSETRTVSIKRDVGYAAIDGAKSRYKPYMFIQEYSDTAIENYSIKLLSGRLPQTNSELVVMEDLLEGENVDYQIGDVISLSLGERRYIQKEGMDEPALKEELVQGNPVHTDESGVVDEYLKVTGEKQYTIVGIMERPFFEFSYFAGYACISGFDASIFSAEETTVNAYVEVKQPDAGIFGHAENLAMENDIAQWRTNDELLRYMGIIRNDGVMNMLLGLSAVIMTIIIVGSVSLIYNAFAISVSERFRHLGMLSSVGATARQKRNSVFFEGAVIGLISIPIGIFFGVLGIEITFRAINPIMTQVLAVETELHAVMKPSAILAAVLLSVLTIFISVYIPARRASRVSPIDAIRQTADIKLSGKNVRTSRITAKLFGIEGNVALKNLKRNKKRYQATVFSLVISLVLFLTVNYFGNSLKSSYGMTTNDVDYDVSVSINSEVEDLEELVENIMNAKHADSAKEVHEIDYIMPQDSGYLISRVCAVDDDTLRAYAKEAGVSAEKLFDPKEKAAIAVDTITYLDEEQHKYIEKKMMETDAGQSWKLYVYGGGTDAEPESPVEKEFAQLKLEGFTHVLPTGVSTTYQSTGAVFIISKAVRDQLLLEMGDSYGDTVGNSHYVYLKSEEPEKLTEELELLENQRVYVWNITEMYQTQEQMLFLMSVFVYGFITLITLICIANIFNTISTSIVLRRREFAMLRSVGMTPAGFNRMIRYESIFYGLKALLYGLPISIIAMYLLHKSYMNSFEFPFVLPWASIGIAILAVFAVVFVTMMYASSKIKKENIIDSLKQEII